jgi:hypothetical protein
MNKEISAELEEALSVGIDGNQNRFISDDEYQGILDAISTPIDLISAAVDTTSSTTPNESRPEQPAKTDTLLIDENIYIDKSAKKKPRKRVSIRFKAFFDPKIWPANLGDMDDHESWPKKIYIGFLANVKKKDLVGYIDEWIYDNGCNRSSCSYQAIAWNGGFAFEVHEGGAGRGALQSVLRLLTAQDEVVVPSNDRSLRVSKRFDGFSSYFLNEFEKQSPTNEVVFKESLAPVYKRNHGLMLSGLIAGVFSVLFLLASWLLVYTIYNKSKVAVFAPVTVEMPAQQISKIADISKRDDAFLKSLIFTGGKWKINLETVVQPEPIAPIEPPITATEPQLPQASVGKDLFHLHQDLVNTLAEPQR